MKLGRVARIVVLAGIGVLVAAASTAGAQWVDHPRLAFASFPAAATTNKAGMIFDETNMVPRWSDGTSWNYGLQPLLAGSDAIPQPEGPTGAQATQASTTTYQGGSYRAFGPRRPTNIIIRATTVSAGGGTIVVGLYQSTNGGGDGTALLVASASVVIAATGTFTTALTPVSSAGTIQPGVFFMVWGKLATSPGNVTMRVYNTVAYELLNSVVETTTHPTGFTTTLSTATFPASINPLPTGGGGDTTAATTDTRILLRFK